MRSKNIVLVSLFLIVLYGFSCSSTKKVVYQPPEDTAERAKKFLVDSYYKGEILFETNCTKCHNKKKSLKTFTDEQLHNYEIRFSNQTHSKNLQPMDIHQPDLEMIIFYLKETIKLNKEES